MDPQHRRDKYRLPPIPPDFHSAEIVSLDFETRDPDIRKLGPGDVRGGLENYVCGVGLAFDNHAVYLPTHHAQGPNHSSAEVWRYLRLNFARFRGKLVAANAQYELGWLNAYRCPLRPEVQILDPQVSAVLLDNRHLSYSLEAIAEREGLSGKSEESLYAAVRELGGRVTPNIVKSRIWELHPADVEEYGIQDVLLPLEIMRRHMPRLWMDGLDKTYHFQASLLPILSRMRSKGTLIDLELLDRIDGEQEKIEAESIRRIEELTGLEVTSILSASRCAEMLDVRGIEYGQTDKGNPSITADFLAGQEDEVCQLLLTARRAKKIRSTYTAGLRKLQVDGYVHGSFNGMGARRTLRMSSSRPNQQNQPRSQYKDWRKVYVAPRGKLVAKLDFSTQEPRIALHFAEILLGKNFYLAEELRQNTAVDLHSRVAELAIISREDAKPLHLGLCYGMGSGRMADDLGLPTETKWFEWWQKYMVVGGEETQDLLRRFHEGVPHVKELGDYLKGTVRHTGYVTTLMGNRLHFPRTRDGKVDWLHKAINYLVQGSASDQMKKAILAVDPRHDIRMAVHDELVLYVDSAEEAVEVGKLMANAVQLRVPSIVDVSVGDTWGSCEEIERVVGEWQT